MLDLAHITKSLTPAETPGLDTLDPRFQEIATLVEAGEFAKAADQTQALLSEGIVDIRVISYFLYGAFLEKGIAGLADVLKAVTALVGANWAAVGPASKKEKHADAGLTWFLGRMFKRLDTTEKEKGDEWTAWTTSVTPEQVQAALEAADGFRAAVGPLQLPSPRVSDTLKQITEWLKAFSKIVAASKAPEPEPAPEAEPAAPPPGTAPAATAPVAGGAPGVPDRFMVEGSVHLQELAQKLEAFEMLIKKDEHTRAAVIANDINTLVEKFDPRIYFPKMFSAFYKLSAKNVEKLQPILDGKDSSPAWKAFEQLYRVDLEAFVE